MDYKAAKMVVTVAMTVTVMLAMAVAVTVTMAMAAVVSGVVVGVAMVAAVALQLMARSRLVKLRGRATPPPGRPNFDLASKGRLIAGGTAGRRERPARGKAQPTAAGRPACKGG